MNAARCSMMLLTVACGGTTLTDRLSNGGFEQTRADGSLPGWTLRADGPEACTWGVDTSVAEWEGSQEGLRAVTLPNPRACSIVTEAITVQSRGPVAITGWYQTERPNNLLDAQPPAVRVTWLSAAGATVASQTTAINVTEHGPWHAFEASLNAPPDAAKVELALGKFAAPIHTVVRFDGFRLVTN